MQTSFNTTSWCCVTMEPDIRKLLQGAEHCDMECVADELVQIFTGVGTPED